MAPDLKDVFKDVPGGVRKYGVVGWPVAHSLSPAMHNAAIRTFGLDADYRAVPVPPDAFKEFIREAQDLPLSGFNVTVPFKEKVWDAGLPDFSCDGTAADSALSVNTVVRGPQGWRGTSTDLLGFLGDIRDHGVDLRGKNVVLLGAGGSANALAPAFRGARLTIINRTRENARRLVTRLRALEKDLSFSVRTAEDARDIERSVREADVLVNTTSLGLKPGEGHIIDLKWLANRGKGPVVYDLIYHRETELLAAARKAGARAINGLGMLVNQGALSFEIWFGEELKKNAKYTASFLRQAMRRAAEDELKRRSTT